MIDGLAEWDTAPRTVDSNTEPDLFFGLLGAGAHLAIVLSFKLRLHPVSARLPSSMLVYPLGRAKELSHWWRRWQKGCPKEIQTSMVFEAAKEGKEAVVKVSSRGQSKNPNKVTCQWIGHRVGPLTEGGLCFGTHLSKDKQGRPRFASALFAFRCFPLDTESLDSYMIPKDGGRAER